MSTRFVSALLVCTVFGAVLYSQINGNSIVHPGGVRGEEVRVIPTVPVGAPVAAMPVPVAGHPAESALPAGAVVKCMEGGKVTYSNLGCANDKHPKRVEMNFTAGVTSPSPELVKATLKRVRADTAESGGFSAEMAAPARSAQRNPETAMQCQYLAQRNKEIDQWARQPQSGIEQDRLKAEKLDIIRELRRLAC